ncbi:MAG: hypothetical protein ACKV2T_36895 [Kofleriaceae bacterium]
MSVPMMFTRIGFTMFHLEAYQNHALDEPSYFPVQVLRSRNAMSAFFAIPRQRR